ncbi:hypothetical protein KUL17_21470 [Alteromonas sp. KUL17]|uniref:motility associated factor glycosyltransferase family protein n=1 Tax=Alteromonas sp. KUL17 TaxID=2480796 RepID=UPI0010382163|nr:6-hydroxymethylpterin diphosphokinase MptE-like protein [Alteromonas sp. KUL17]TAP26272.1 DUF115 domain-containing protein [Alteromonas sp. KUL17]GEA03250.1 hypothetical protein KUL17_21470 [Alteromonas sp. KUL17]
MLKSISLHLDNEERQSAIELKAAPLIQEQLRKNKVAFRTYAPNIYSQIIDANSKNHSLFCNKNGDLNIVDLKNGRAFYGLAPSREIKEQCFELSSKCLCVDLLNGESGGQIRMPKSIPLIAVLGIGIGKHIEWLLQNYSIKHLVIFEPEQDFFLASLSSIDWHAVLRLAKIKGTAIYFQLGKDGRDLYVNIEELREHFSLNSLFIFKHYNHSVFDQLTVELEIGTWRDFRDWVFRESDQAQMNNYIPLWTQSLNSQVWSQDNLDHERFERNLNALKTYFPAVHTIFCKYTPSVWHPVGNKAGEVNVKHHKTGAYFWGTSPREDSELSFNKFAKTPNKDGLILGYHGKKLSKYLHYQMVVKCDETLKSVEESIGELPSTVKSIIVFGLGIGYQMETLSFHRNVRNLFICEPNSDFFFASLYAVEWAKIFEKVAEEEGRIYLNIGDDGTNLVEDFLRKFHTFGPFLLANTYFYQGYYNTYFNESIHKLRQQLQTLISMGDFYDHAKYGITHTCSVIKSGVPILNNQSKDVLSSELKDVPVFIVGNGPSLDRLIPVIKESAHKVIIISCGTALQTLHRHGIAPDFHSEIEINRSTFDWAARIGDLNYLKRISLVSCNGIHPDTCNLYKDSYIALKEGEASTSIVSELFESQHFPLLKYAYPTVANFAMDLVNSFDLRQVYLLGVDLGFVDANYHHSKKSAYYDENGIARFDYKEDNDTSFTLPGNFRKFVYSKFEFKVSKSVLEQSLNSRSDIYNLSDGARIEGTTPLAFEDVLVLSSEYNKQQAISIIKSKGFTPLEYSKFQKLFNARFNHDALIREFRQLLALSDIEVDTREQAETFIEAIRDTLVESYKRKVSLLFFLMNGTLNYITSAFNKALNVNDDSNMLVIFNDLKSHWADTCEDILRQIKYDFDSLDFISSFAHERIKVFLPMMLQAQNVNFTLVNKAKQLFLDDTLDLLGITKGVTHSAELYGIVFGETNVTENYARLCRIISDETQLKPALKNAPAHETIVFLPGDFRHEACSPICSDVSRLRAAILSLTGSSSVKLVLPKLIIDNVTQKVSDYYDIETLKHYFAYDGGTFVAFSNKNLKVDEKLLLNGERYKFIPELRDRDLVRMTMSLDKQQDRKNVILSTFTSERALNG